MGTMTFALPADLPADIRSALERCWLASGYDGSPAVVRRKLDNSFLTVSRVDNESGHLQLSWPRGTQESVVSTATLRLRDEPYRLLTELTRGSVNRIRRLVADLTSAGIPFPPELGTDLAELTRTFGRQVLETDSSIESVREMIEKSITLAGLGAEAFTQYRLDARKHASGPLPTWFGCRVSQPLSEAEADAYTSAFTAIRIVPNWARLEPLESQFKWDELDPLVQWANEAGLGVSLGPLIDLRGPFPPWLATWAGDIPSLSAFMSDFIGTIVGRYRDQVRVWQLFTGFNHADACGLREDDRIRLAARLLDTAKEVDSQGVWVIGVSQPWGDYLTAGGQSYSPLVFADTLLRAGYHVGGIELELLLGPETGPTGSHRRDLLDQIQLMDLFDHLSIPLEITIGDQLISSTGTEAAGIPNLPAGLAAAVSSPTAQAVYWDSWAKNDPCSRVPGGHLWDGSGVDRLANIRQFRQRWLR